MSTLDPARAPGKLSLASRFMALEYRLFHMLRHKRAFETATENGSAEDFAAFDRARQCLIVTFKGSGEPVPTPVNFGLGDRGRLYFRTEPHVAKVKRLQKDPHVRVCPCNLRGKPTGPFVEATARVLPREESDRAYEAIASNWRSDMKLAEIGMDRVGLAIVYVEVTPAASPD